MIDFVRSSNRVVVISDDDTLVEELESRLITGKRLDNGQVAPSDISFQRYSPTEAASLDCGRFGLCLVDLSSNGAVDVMRQLPRSSRFLGKSDQPYYVALTTDEFTVGDRKAEFPREKFHDTVRKNDAGKHLDYLSDRIGVLLNRTTLGIPVRTI